MTLDFNFANVVAVEFGVGRDLDAGSAFHTMPVDADVQAALQDMAVQTWRELSELGDATHFEPSEKYAGTEYVALPLADRWGDSLRALHTANNIPMDPAALSDPQACYCYFVRMVDVERRRLTGVRRATQFKGVLKSRLIQLTTDALKLVEGNVFKLDFDFDLLIDNTTIHVLRPVGLESIGRLQREVLAAVPGNIKLIERELRFVDFGAIADYAATHPRAARYLASILQQDIKGIEKRRLKVWCKKTGVSISEEDGKLHVSKGDVLGFLEVLDRRRFEIELIADKPERFQTPSRRKLP